MTNYTWKSLVFLLLGLILILPVCLVSQRIYAASMEEEVFRLGGANSILVAGDSHAEVSVNPALMPNSVNIASSAESYLFTYYKLRHFLAKNPQISTVILGCSWHNFSPKYQDDILFSDAHNQLEKYYQLLDAEGRAKFASFRASYLVPYLRYSLGLPLKLYLDQIVFRKMLGMRLTKENFNFFGGYKQTGASMVSGEKINEKLRSYFAENEYRSETGEITCQYFDRIIRLCSARNIKVILLNAPVQERYLSGVPNRMKKSFEAVISGALKANPQVTYLDYSRYPLPAAFYYDGDHVNSHGAEVVTMALSRVVK